MSKYFTLKELTDSSVARMEGIDNSPNGEVANHLNELMDVLDELRMYVGSPIRVTSGYRCPSLNKRVGGASTSAHQFGYAADLQPIGLPFSEFVKRVNAFLDGGVEFDQCIIESNSRSKWVHFGIRNKYGQQRKQRFRIDKCE